MSSRALSHATHCRRGYRRDSEAESALGYRVECIISQRRDIQCIYIDVHLKFNNFDKNLHGQTTPNSEHLIWVPLVFSIESLHCTCTGAIE
jgi:hypothetical protein